MNRFVTREGVRLHVAEQGAGAEVVVLHGAVASHRQLAVAREHLGRSRRVLAPDLRGMGDSEGRPDPVHWVADTIALIEQLTSTPVVLAGTSLGARVALAVALQRPDLVRLLALDSPMLANDPAGEVALDHLLGESTMPPPFAENVDRWQAGRDWRQVVRSYQDMRATGALQAQFDFAERLGEVAPPVLVSRGDVDDDIHPIRHAVEAHAGLPASWLWIAPSCPFSTIIHRPEAWVAVLDEVDSA